MNNQAITFKDKSSPVIPRTPTILRISGVLAHPNDADPCLICLENITDNNWCVCIRCKIQLHNMCEQQYRGKKGHTECPHCRRIGTMGGVRT
jgi:hypothetical protein